MISHSRVDISPEDVAAVATTVAGGMLAQGERVRQFEAAVAERLGVTEAAAVQSGTAALHLALLALGIGPGDEVILPSYLCVAPLNAIRYTGATPVLADVEEESGNIDPQAAARRLTPRTRAIIVPHLFGHPADLTALCRLSVPIIEDLAQAIGASFGGRPLGGFGTVAACSFYATKVMTCGEGGMVLSRERGVIDQVRDLRDYDEKEPYRLRYNSKLTEPQAALGLSQEGRLSETIRRRREIAARYDAGLRSVADVELPVREPAGGDIFYRYVIRLRQGRVESFIKAMAERGITCRRPIFRPLHQLLSLPGYPNSDRVQERAVSLPIYPGLTREEEERVVRAVIECAGGESHGQ